MKCAVTPLFRSDIFDGFGKIPAMTVKILNVILTLAVRMLFGFRQNDRPMLARALAVTFCIFDSNLNALRIVGNYVAFGEREAAIPGFHLDAMIGDA